jgi:hypothetical protein
MRESPLGWTCKRTYALSGELFVQRDIRASNKTVAKLLRDHGCSLQITNCLPSAASAAPTPSHPLGVTIFHRSCKRDECGSFGTAPRRIFGPNSRFLDEVSV